ncbi:MAG: chromate transporter [Ruminococcaceae bacterium]|nr:chromate transporter [Oscillospiraceae bacterium]
MKELFDLFFTFMKIGAVSFGGGYAMLPILTREFAEKRDWVTDTELNDYFAIGQVTPGIIAVNVATFIGNKRKGFIGGIMGTIGLVTVPVIIITLIAALLTNFADIEIVKHAFSGIRVAVCVLILSAILKLWKKSVPDIPTLIICLILFGLSAFGGLIPVVGKFISPVWMVIVAAVAGIIIQSIRTARRTKGGNKQ